VEEEGVKEGAKTRDLLSEGRIEGGELSLTDGEEGGAVKEAAEMHGGVEGGPFAEGEDGREDGREGGLCVGWWWWWLGGEEGRRDSVSEEQG